jgi:WD40 repeat protein
MDWSPTATNTSLRLLTGDIHSKIFLTNSTPSGFVTGTQPFASHTNSVEDIQWSPSEETVFASCSSDRSIKIWDVRVKNRKSVVGVENAHDSDINVISWNRGTSYLLVSGGDEGGIKIWDLRNFKGFVSSLPHACSYQFIHSKQCIWSTSVPCSIIRMAHRPNNVNRMASNRRLNIRRIGSRRSSHALGSLRRARRG